LGQEVFLPNSVVEFHRDQFLISTDRTRLDLNLIHAFLTKVYWSEGIPLETVKRAIENSLCFGIHHQAAQIGFGRVITDYATLGYIGDVFIVEKYRGRGLAKWLVESMTAHPELQGLRRWMLATRDAHGLYSRFGFRGLKSPEKWMEIHNAGVYRR
jgi:GNAT superfamily N-acetyltransferase